MSIQNKNSQIHTIIDQKKATDPRFVPNDQSSKDISLLKSGFQTGQRPNRVTMNENQPPKKLTKTKARKSKFKTAIDATPKSALTIYSTAAHLRAAVPYIQAYSAKRVIVLLNSPSFTDECVENIAQDIALLYSLNIQPIVIINPDQQLAPYLTEDALSFENLKDIQGICNRVCNTLMAKLTVGLINAGVGMMDIPAVSGNYITARPEGVIHGVDRQHYGLVRRIKREPIVNLLENKFIVMVPPIGHSPSGETYYVDPFELTLSIADALEVEKVVLLGESVLRDSQGEIVHEWRPSHEQLFDNLSVYQNHLVRFASQALLNGVQRVHFLHAHEPGAMIQELFTRDGCGTMATLEFYEQIRTAKLDDASGIFELIQPLEEQGILVRRPRETIEAEINHFTVVERDHSIIGCAALYPYSNNFAELACFVVSPTYRHLKRGDVLLENIVRRAQTDGIEKLFVLTTQTADWFMERGFKPAQLDDLPIERQEFYNLQRQSKIFIRDLTQEKSL